ncbi:hypothetical protein SISSUDRAFT_1034499 [Sistotremastrum suecicum HHB10207 ss-3]|uniref:Uncharacterized protein n=1 Tax=Sistotremastrum suecicum HHB10207 ss-3 TaxID=1314776 RepID=A0A166BZE6_9AGAM|nr:hypothetical protein SISSUDRAFT_1034499 [Sistotremastrum suecicum HHB10207 ss-3]
MPSTYSILSCHDNVRPATGPPLLSQMSVNPSSVLSRLPARSSAILRVDQFLGHLMPVSLHGIEPKRASSSYANAFASLTPTYPGQSSRHALLPLSRPNEDIETIGSCQETYFNVCSPSIIREVAVAVKIWEGEAVHRFYKLSQMLNVGQH